MRDFRFQLIRTKYYIDVIKVNSSKKTNIV